MQIVRIRLDLARYVFEVHGVDHGDRTVIRKILRREAVAAFFAELPPCIVGMEASNGAHYWARVLADLGHGVRLASPKFVTPCVKSSKNDRNDGEAICELVGRPSMRFVPPESSEQLTIQAVHRLRQRLVSDRPRLVNQIRGLLVIATALVAAVGDRSCFSNGRQSAAWLALVPRQRSTGGQTCLSGISNRGDRYLRTLMIHGARAALGKASGKQDPGSLWLRGLRERRHPNVAAVSLANKNARIVWALLVHDEDYHPARSKQAA